MKKKTIWMTTALALMVALPGSAVFAASTADTTEGTESTQPQVRTKFNKDFGPGGRIGGIGLGEGLEGGMHVREFQGGGKHGGMGIVAGGKGMMFGSMHGVHGEAYMLLLSEKYAPELVDEFKAAYDESEQLQSQLEAAREADMADRDAKLQEMKTALEDIKAKVTSGELTQEQANEQIKQLRNAQKGEKPVRIELTEEHKVQMEAKMQLHEDFQAAVQALTDDGSIEPIASVLPKLLEELDAQNQQLTERLAAQ